MLEAFPIALSAFLLLGIAYILFAAETSVLVMRSLVIASCSVALYGVFTAILPNVPQAPAYLLLSSMLLSIVLAGREHFEGDQLALA